MVHGVSTGGHGLATASRLHGEAWELRAGVLTATDLMLVHSCSSQSDTCTVSLGSLKMPAPPRQPDPG